MAGTITVHGVVITPADLVIVTTRGEPEPSIDGYELVGMASYYTDTTVRRYRRLVKLEPGTLDPRD
jgi:hypothetical protein